MAITVDVLTGGVNNHETTSEAVNGIATDFITEGIVGAVGNTSGVAPTTGGYGAEAQGTPDMTVAVDAGTAYVAGTPSTQVSQTFRVKNSASANVTISANSSGSTKYDWIYIKLDATKLNGPNSAGDDVATLVASRSSSASTDDGTPPTYGYAIAVVTVANGATSITNSMIRDIRTQSAVNAGASSGASTWTDTGYAFGTVTYLGNRSYTCVISNADVTGFLSNGMRLKMTRTVTAPTQCADLESGSSQYFNKTTPNKSTFTDDFVVSAWVKLESYGSNMAVMTRYNGTSGWNFMVLADGTILLRGYNASSANYSGVTSYQSIPLNKWVHIAAQLDMSAFTATTTTSYVMIDGVDVPATVSRAGTNPTALVQAGNLEVGGINGGTSPFDGKIAQAAFYTAKVTQATIKASIPQTLTGSETSLGSAYSFSNSITDLNTTTPNDLTPQGSAVATATDTPFAGGSVGTTEYGIITANSFSTNTTLTVQVPEGYAIPTSGGVSAVAYSTQDVPYGFPRDKGKWRVEYLNRAGASSSNNANYGAFDGGGWSLTVPVGVWDVGYNFNGHNSSVTSVTYTLSPTSQVGVALGSETSFMWSRIVQSSAAAISYNNIVTSVPVSLTSQQTYVIYTRGGTTSSGIALYGGATISAEFNYV